MEGSVAQTIKDKLGVAEVIKSYLELQPAGRNLKARCPFHNEKTPSFIVSPDRGTWHCFGCNEGGDIFTFVMKYENLEFGEALKILAERAGVELRRMSPMEYKQFGLLYDLQAAARDFFIKQLEATPVAQKYLTSRGLTSETIQTFEIGWAPDNMDALARHLINFGYDAADVIRAGLAGKSDRGMIFDRFRGRIMFPIANHAGKIVAFTGRILPAPSGVDGPEPQVAKYINSPETPIFQKSRILYNFSRAKSAIREKDRALMVEGQMDAIMVHQAGVAEVVATSGTALTRDHLLALRRITDKLALSFDSDEAGQAALERAIDLAESADFGVTVAVVPEGKDPAELAVHDPNAVQELLKNAVPAPKFYFHRYLEPAGDPRDRSYLLKVRTVAGKLSKIASPVEKSVWMKELAKQTGLSEVALSEEAARAAEEENAPQTFREDKPAPTAVRSLSRQDLLAEQLLGTAVMKNDFTLAEDVVLYLPQHYKDALAALREGKKHSDDPELDALMNAIYLRGEDMNAATLDSLKDQLRREHVRARRQELTALVRDAERGGNSVALEAALKELSELPVV